MKGFGIYVKNNLLEPKHVEKFGANPLFLYLWLLDKMTSVNENGVGKVLGNKPVNYLDVKVDLGIDDRTYRRWVKKLREEGYINTVRAPHGLIITVNKAEKIFGKKRTDKSVLTQPESSDKSVLSDRTNLSKSSDKSDRSNKDNTKTIQLDNTNSTNVLGDESPKRYGNAEINELFDYWEEMTGHPITTQAKRNRAAASNLLKKHGKEALRKMIGGVAYSHGERYAPTIANFSQLQSKWDELIIWGKKHKGRGDKGRIIKI